MTCPNVTLLLRFVLGAALIWSFAESMGMPIVLGEIMVCKHRLGLRFQMFSLLCGSQKGIGPGLSEVRSFLLLLHPKNIPF